MHSDKIKWIENNTWIIIIKLGESRYFDFTDLDDRRFFHEILSAGTAIFCKSSTSNIHTKHGVPPMENVGRSGSIVFRSKGALVPWETVYENAKKSQQDKIKRWANKDTAKQEILRAKARRDDAIRQGVVVETRERAIAFSTMFLSDSLTLKLKNSTQLPVV